MQPNRTSEAVQQLLTLVLFNWRDDIVGSNAALFFPAIAKKYKPMEKILEEISTCETHDGEAWHPSLASHSAAEALAFDPLANE